MRRKPNVVSKVSEIRGARENREYERALLLAEEYVSKEPEDPAGWSELGKVAVRLGQARRAADATEEALRLSPGDPDLLFDLGRWSAKDGDFQQAVDAFRELEAVADEQVWSYLANAVLLFRGFCLIRTCRWAEAAADAMACGDDGDV